MLMPCYWPYLSGARGDALFVSDWLKILDTPIHTALAFAQQAAQQGWLEYRHSGQVNRYHFPSLLGGGKTMSEVEELLKAYERFVSLPLER